MVPVPEPTIGLATQVGKAIWWAGGSIYATREERREAALLLRRALVRTVCPDGVDEPVAGRDVAVARLEARLAKTRVPGAPSGGKLAGLGRKLRGLNPYKRRGYFDELGEIDGPAFVDRLSLWARGGADAAEVAAALDRVECPARAMDPKSLGERFPHALKTELKYAKKSTFRRELIKGLWQHEQLHAYVEEDFGASERFLARTVPATVLGGLTYGAAELANAADPLLIGAGGAVAALVAALALVRRRPRATGKQLIARDVALHWAADVLVALTGKPTVPGAAGLRAGLVDTLGSLEEGAQRPGARSQWARGWNERLAPLVGHLKDEVIPQAHGAEDERLEVVLLQLRDLLIRSTDGRASWRDTLLAMLILVDETAPPEADTGSTGAAPAEEKDGRRGAAPAQRGAVSRRSRGRR